MTRLYLLSLNSVIVALQRHTGIEAEQAARPAQAQGTALKAKFDHTVCRCHPALAR